ncbi:MAG: matrixin family metalloprotease [Bacteroidota bacterium]
MKPNLIPVLFFLIGCNTPEIKVPRPKTIVSIPADGRKIQILIQPLNDISTAAISFLKNHIADSFKAVITVLPARELPANAYFAPGKRYKADSLLVFLKPFVSNVNTYVLGVTGKDISTRKGAFPNWGIMGLGYQPGQCCVISDYRLCKYPQTEMQLNERLLKVALHELGHNFGLPHCPDERCMMTDAKGKDKLNNEEGFCLKCSGYLHSKGFRK